MAATRSDRHRHRGQSMKLLLLLFLWCIIGCRSDYSSCDAASFYNGTSFLALQRRLQSRHHVVSYKDCWEALRELDASPGRNGFVRLIYAQIDALANNTGDARGWNREHVWPKSYGVGYTGPDTSDLFALRAADWNVNSARGNLFYGECNSSSCDSPAHIEADRSTAKNGNEFRPPTSVRGDLARSIFYMTLRYDGSEVNTAPLKLSDCPCQYTNTFGRLSDLLQWHQQDPPSLEERRRNDLICTSYQGTRNPFIDFPELAQQFFPTPPANQSLTCKPCQAPAATSTSTPTSNASASLHAGSIAIVAFNTDNPDSFTFLALDTLPPYAAISFADKGWTGVGLRTTEGAVTWRNGPSSVPAGSTMTWMEGAAGTDAGDAYSFTWEEASGFALSASGDQLLAYAPTASTDDAAGIEQAQTTRFLYAVHIDRSATSYGWDDAGSADADSSWGTALPPGLIDGSTAVALPHKDNYVYAGPTRGTRAQLLGNISAAANWRGDNSARGEWDGGRFEVLLPHDHSIGNATETEETQAVCDRAGYAASVQKGCNAALSECQKSLRGTVGFEERKSLLCGASDSVCSPFLACVKTSLRAFGCEAEDIANRLTDFKNSCASLAEVTPSCAQHFQELSRC